MKKFLPTLIAVSTAGLTVALPTLQALVAANPIASVAVGAAAIILSHLAPSPVAPSARPE